MLALTTNAESERERGRAAGASQMGSTTSMKVLATAT
jgi:hypothetical protein